MKHLILFPGYLLMHLFYFLWHFKVRKSEYNKGCDFPYMYKEYLKDWD